MTLGASSNTTVLNIHIIQGKKLNRTNKYYYVKQFYLHEIILLSVMIKWWIPSPSNQLSSIFIDASDVFEAIISSLNPSKAPGIDT